MTDTETANDAWAHELLRMAYNDPDASRRVKRRIRAGLPPVEVDYKGCRMHVHPADNNTEFQIWRRGRSHEERALRDILARLEGAPFYALDVGANAGSFSVRLGAAAPKGSEVHAFEPNPKMRSRLLTNLSLNDLKLVEVHNCAISDAFGEAILHMPAHNLGEARLGEGFASGSSLQVETRPITEFLPQDRDRAVDFMKVDVEGLEDRVIAPLLAAEFEHHHPKILFFEDKHQAHWAYDLNGLLAAAGYRVDKEYGRNALFVKS